MNELKSILEYIIGISIFIILGIAFYYCFIYQGFEKTNQLLTNVDYEKLY